MMSGVRQSNVHSQPSGSKNSSTQQYQSSRRVKETVFPTQAMQGVKHPDSLKAKIHTSKPYVGAPRKLKQNADETLVQPKPLKNSQQLAVMVNTPKDDELVKYMTSLPAYLQRVERTENIQDKALNVGVLDWGRLENWKCNQKDIPVGVGNYASSHGSYLPTKMTTRSSTFHSQARSDTLTSESKLRSNSCRYNSSHNMKSSFQAAGLFPDVGNASKNDFDWQKRGLSNYNNFDRSGFEKISEKGKSRELEHKITSKVENWSDNSTCNRMPTGSNEHVGFCDGEAKQKTERMQRSDVKCKALKQKNPPLVGASSSELRSYEISRGAKEKKSIDDKMKRVELKQEAVDLPRQQEADESKNIVLLLPLKHLRHRRVSTDENVTKVAEKTMSEGFPDKEVFTSEHHLDIRHSCPFPSRAETNKEKLKAAPDAISSLDVESLSSAINSRNSSSENVVGTSRVMDQEQAELACKGRHPSPNRRFSFSLGRMTRSFSFKESSGIPQLSSTYTSVKSGPVASVGSDNSNREKASGHSRARSSPLRRMLDPLLKSKSSSPASSTWLNQPSTGSLSRSYTYTPINATESFPNEKRESSRLQAHLILATNNGFPLFRFVVSNKTIIVAAPTKNSALTAKNNQDCNYILYSIDEIKRKSGSWINQVGKEKTRGFVYNVVGQMKVNGSSFMDLSGNNSSEHHLVQESVLFGVNQRQMGQPSAELMQNTELAAVVVKKPIKSLGCNLFGSDEETNFREKDKSRCLPDNENSTSCTVILPGGTHTLPSTGILSSLIQRWKSGGSCDCGGWDVGCKLRILSNESRQQKLPRISYSFLTSDPFKLFVLGELQQGTPIFSMAPMEKGKYFVEFGPSITSLQAFFIGISLLSSQVSHLDDLSDVYDEKVIQDCRSVNSGMKNIRTKIAEDKPLKHAPCPPVSPVGRV